MAAGTRTRSVRPVRPEARPPRDLRPGDLVAGVVRWTARALAAGTLLFALAFFATHLVDAVVGPPPLPTAPLEPGEWFGFVLMGTLLVGLALGWRRPLVGGGVSLLSLALFYLLLLTLRGRFPGGTVFPALALPGALYLLQGWLERHRSRAT